MLTLQIDTNVFDRILNAKNISARTLSKQLRVKKAPTTRSIDGWLTGEVIAPRWRTAIMDYFETDDCFDQRGCFIVEKLDGINQESLKKVMIYDSITPSAISEWRSGGGIEPDTLIALATFLGVKPVYLLSKGTTVYLALLTEV